jgi:hypothetical protein
MHTMQGFDWKRFALGAGLAASYAIANYLKAMPEPYGAIGIGVAIILAQLAPTPAPVKCLHCGAKNASTPPPPMRPEDLQ